jgi:hypothetical protein
VCGYGVDRDRQWRPPSPSPGFWRKSGVRDSLAANFEPTHAQTTHHNRDTTQDRHLGFSQGVEKVRKLVRSVGVPSLEVELRNPFVNTFHFVDPSSGLAKNETTFRYTII